MHNEELMQVEMKGISCVSVSGDHDPHVVIASISPNGTNSVSHRESCLNGGHLFEMFGPCFDNSAPDLSIIMNCEWHFLGGYNTADLGGRLRDIMSHSRSNGCHGGDGKSFLALF